MNYPDADRLVPATEAMLPTFGAVHIIAEPYGRRPVIGCLHRPGAINGLYEVAFRYGGSLTDDEFPLSALWLDPMDAATRDHLIRRLSLPAWMRDGAGLEPWQSAGLIVCAAADHAPPRLARLIGVLAPWTRRRFTVERHDSETMERRQVPAGSGFPSIYVSGGGWQAPDPIMGRASGPETGEAGKLAADTAALAHGCALMFDADTMVLPWPGGPKLWRRG